MFNLEQVSTSLIEARKKIQKLEDCRNKEFLELSLSDLECFWQLSKIDSTSFEKKLRNILSSLDKNSFDLYISLCKSDIEVFLNYYDKNGANLEAIDKKTIVKSSLTYEEHQSNSAKKSLEKASKKYYDAENQLEGTCYLNEKTNTEMIVLRKLVEVTKKEYLELKTDYSNKCNYFQSKYHEYIPLTFFKFKKIHKELTECLNYINSLQTKRDSQNGSSTDVVNFEIVGITHKICSPYFSHEITEQKLSDFLNLKDSVEKSFIKHGHKEKFLTVIKKISKILKVDTQWEKDLLKGLCLNYSTYNKGNLLENDTENFIKKVNKAFSNLKADGD